MYWATHSRGIGHFSLEFVYILLLMNTCEVALTRAGTCKYNEFKCDNGKCINRNYKCDGDDDCSDRSDELRCAKIKCPYSYQFRCGRRGRCIPKSWICNGPRNCADGSDEANELCRKPEVTSKSTQKTASNTSTTSVKTETTSHSQGKSTQKRTNATSTISVKTETTSRSQTKSTQKIASTTSTTSVKSEATSLSQASSTQKISTASSFRDARLDDTPNPANVKTEAPSKSKTKSTQKKASTAAATSHVGLRSRRTHNTLLVVGLLAGICCLLLLPVVGVSVILYKCRKSQPNSTILLSDEEGLAPSDDHCKESTAIV